MTIYVFADSGYDPEVIIAEAETEAEAVGKATAANHGIAPRAEPEPLSDVLDNAEGDGLEARSVKLV